MSHEPEQGPDGLGLILEPYDSPLRWLIESRHGNGAYLVDLGANNERGLCPCKWFQTNTGPDIREGKRIVKHCYHVQEAERRFQRWARHQFAKIDKNIREAI